MKIAFLDRDGTINKDYPDEAWQTVTKPELLDGAIEGLRFLQEMGYQIILLTNQYIIGEGIISEIQYQEFSNLLLKELSDEGIRVMDVFYCPHTRKMDCDCMKPKIGMVQQAMRKYSNIDLQDSIMVGDSFADKYLAENIGIEFYGINVDCFNRISGLSDLRNVMV